MIWWPVALTPILAVILVALAFMGQGCARLEHDPLDVFTADPNAFTFWVMPF